MVDQVDNHHGSWFGDVEQSLRVLSWLTVVFRVYSRP